MKLFYALLFAIAVPFSVCNCQTVEPLKTELPPLEFAAKIKEYPLAQIVDVRTAEEFAEGHIPNAINIDWKHRDNFDKQIALLDKSRPVFIYCKSGRRSSDAADKMRADGFKEVYELKGGILEWRKAGLPETNEDVTLLKGMSKQEFDALLVSDKLVLVDFYTKWCASCKKMLPYIDEISKEMADRVTVIRIDADENLELCEVLKIESLPVLTIYENTKIKWQNEGCIAKEEIIKHLK